MQFILESRQYPNIPRPPRRSTVRGGYEYVLKYAYRTDGNHGSSSVRVYMIEIDTLEELMEFLSAECGVVKLTVAASKNTKLYANDYEIPVIELQD